MTVKIGVVMDPIEHINTKKDSTLAMLRAAWARGWTVYYMTVADLYVRDGVAKAQMRTLQEQADGSSPFTLGEPLDSELAELDVLLMRKDPPFDMAFVYATYMLEMAESAGVLVVNKPAALRDVNEKFAITRFPQCCVPTLITNNAARLNAFISEHGDAILKPLDGMGGASIFRVSQNDPNRSVILETMLTGHGATDAEQIMAQQFIPDISAGDKRILVVDGEPVPYALARIPAAGETRGNLAAGGRGEGRELSERDRWICAQVRPFLQANGLLFVGLDVIGDYLTEINVTSPTCIRELDAQYDLNIGGQLIDAIAQRLNSDAASGQANGVASNGAVFK